jgi:hypothetical protein
MTEWFYNFIAKYSGIIFYWSSDKLHIIESERAKLILSSRWNEIKDKRVQLTPYEIGLLKELLTRPDGVFDVSKSAQENLTRSSS